MSRAFLLVALATLAGAACDGPHGGGAGAPADPAEPFRPRFHVSPAQGWMNDPNGLVFASGTYHLFYQFDPDHRLPLRQHWGHARSRDLVRWEDRPIALHPDRVLGLAFSGSAVVDRDDTSGLCGEPAGCLIAIFTQSGGSTGGQKQSLAISHDDGETWLPFAGNPVLESPGPAAFRDPKVFWHEPTRRWVMVLAAGDRAQLYASPNLREWSLLSELGMDLDLGGVWECPDLFELAVDGGAGGRRWVLKVDFNPGPLVGFSGARYLVGDFDGERFRADDSGARAVDGGADFYAAQSWSDVPDGRRLWIAWMSNWKYALTSPTSPWRGAMTVPREVSLASGPAGLALVQQPAPELAALHGHRLLGMKDVRIAHAERRLASIEATAFDLHAVLRLGGARRVELAVRASEGGDERTTLSYDAVRGELALDRSSAGIASFDRRFAARHALPLALATPDGPLDLRVLVDESSVEVFAAGGRVVLTDLVFPAPSSAGLSLTHEGGDPWVDSLTIDAMGSVRDPGG